MLLFGRRWTVQVGALQTSELDVKFKIKRRLAGRAGKCELDIFNLSAEHRAQAKAAGHPFVQIQAGFREGTSLLFQGDARKVDDIREDTTWTLKVTAGDGETAIRSARVGDHGTPGSFTAGTGIAAVVQALAGAMGVGVGNALTALQGSSVAFPSGTVVHGRASEELGRLCDSAGLLWSVQDGNLQLLPVNGALQREAILLSDASGLVGSPQQGKGGVVKATALLIPGLVPGQVVQLQSRGTNGVFRIETAEYVGESRGTGPKTWAAELTLRVRP